jgi:hypothetical protein
MQLYWTSKVISMSIYKFLIQYNAQIPVESFLSLFVDLCIKDRQLNPCFWLDDPFESVEGRISVKELVHVLG